MVRRAIAHVRITISIMLLIAASLVLGLPTWAFAEDDAPEVTRGQWIHQLVETFEVTVEDENYPEEYFSDVTVDDPYYQDLVKAVEFGIIDVPAGGEVRADDAATRDFAAHTLNFCLGFQLEDETYSFSDAEACEYPADAQVAVDRGWFSLISGEFVPSQEVTNAECVAAFADATVVWQSTVIDDNHENVVEVEEGVKVIPEGTPIAELEEGTFAISDCPIALASGDTFVAYFYGVPRSFVATEVSVSDNVTTVVTEEADPTEAFETVDCEGSFEPDIDDITVTVSEGDDSLRGTKAGKGKYEPFEVKIDPAGNSVTVKGKLQTKDGVTGAAATASFEIKLSDLKVDWKDSAGEGHAILRGSVDLGVDAKGSISKEVPIISIRILGIGEIPVALDLGLSGDVYVGSQNSFSCGVQWTRTGSFRVVHSLVKDSFTMKAKAEMHAEVKISAGINLVLFKADLYCKVGPHAEVTVQQYSDGVPQQCTTVAIYLQGSFGAEAKVVGIVKFDYKILDFWSKSSSPVRLYYHYEDGLVVDRCTRGQHEDPYITDPNSKSAQDFGGGGPLPDLADSVTSGANYQLLTDKTLTNDMYVIGNLTVDANLYLAGHDLIVTGNLIMRKDGKTLNLQGGRLFVGGILQQAAGTLDVAGGSVSVAGNYYMRSGTIGPNGEAPTSYCYSTLVMECGGDLVEVGGDLLYDARSECRLSAGRLVVSGDFSDQQGYFRPADGFLVVLDGASGQGVELSEQSCFASLVVENPGAVAWSGWVNIRSLESDVDAVTGSVKTRWASLNGHALSVSGDLEVLGAGVDLQGGALSVGGLLKQSAGTIGVAGGALSAGTLQQAAGTLDVAGGSVSVAGNYYMRSGTIGPNGEAPTSYCYSTLVMECGGDLVEVGGDLLYDARSECRLSAGRLVVSGDFSDQQGYFYPAGDHLTVLAGTDVQQVYFASTQSRFNKLLLTQDMQNYVFNPEGCWVELIGADYVDPQYPPAVTNVVVSPNPASVRKSESVSFQATVYGYNGISQQVSWTVAGAQDEGTAISDDGVLSVGTNETQGTLTVKAAAQDDSTKVCEVVVEVLPAQVAAEAITLSTTALWLLPGEEAVLAATLEPADSTSMVTWASSDESVATVTDGGLVTAVAVGETTITAVAGDATAECLVSVLDLSTDGWVDLPSGGKGYARDGALVTGWLDLDGAKYWFGEDGAMATGWTDVEVGGNLMHYYFNPASGNLVRGTWFRIDGKAYYFRPSGNLATGWATIADNGTDKKYYFEDDGTLVTGWREMDGRRYYFRGSGSMATGFATIDGTTYLFRDSGALARGWADLDGRKYYANDDGTIVRGQWLEVGGGRYWFRPSGSMATGWAEIDGATYFFRPSGNMATGWADVPDDAYKRYFDGEGHMVTGWQEIGGNTYYFRSSGAMQTGEATIDGVDCVFSDKGVLISGGPAAGAALVDDEEPGASGTTGGAGDGVDGAETGDGSGDFEAGASDDGPAATIPTDGDDTPEADVDEGDLVEPAYDDGHDRAAETEAVFEGTLGTCSWVVTEDGELVIGPAEGEEEGVLPDMADDEDDDDSDEGEGLPDDDAVWAASSWLDPEVAELVTGVTVLEGTCAEGSIAGLFAGLENLEAADLTGLDASGVTDASRLFDGCASLREVDLTGWDLASLELADDAFRGCDSLETVWVDEGFDIDALGIPEEVAFVPVDE